MTTIIKSVEANIPALLWRWTFLPANGQIIDWATSSIIIRLQICLKEWVQNPYSFEILLIYLFKNLGGFLFLQKEMPTGTNRYHLSPGKVSVKMYT